MRVSPQGTVQRSPGGREKTHVAFPKGGEIPGPKAVPGRAPLASTAAGIVRLSREEPSPIPSVCLENEPQGRALQAVHELCVRPGLPGALAELPLPYLPRFCSNHARPACSHWLLLAAFSPLLGCAVLLVFPAPVQD